MVEADQIYQNQTHKVKVAKDSHSEFYLLQWPANGLVYAPWFETAADVQEFLEHNGFQLVV